MHLNEPYPFSIHNSLKLQYSVGSFLFTSFFLIYLQPFSAGPTDNSIDFIVTCGYGLVVGTIIFFCETLFPLLRPSIFKDEYWTFLKQFTFSVLVLVIIVGGLAGYEVLVGNELNIWGITKYVFTIGTFLIAGFTFIDERFFLRSKLARFQKLELVQSPDLQKPIEVKGQSPKELLVLTPDQFIYAVADGNYLSVYWWAEGHIQRTLLRQTIKNLTEQLKAFPYLVQVHRSYLVNKMQVSQVTGNKNGLQVSIRNTNHVIPVSRSFVDLFQAR